jgi:putative CocE/NonD family hydrolase
VLSYTSAQLENDTEITGPVTLVLSAASSAPDTDFVGRLSDVYPDGRAINITEGVLRARFRKKEYWEKPQLITPGVIYEYTIDLQATSNVFKKDHRFRLDITSSSYPLWDRNLNTGNLPWLDTDMKKAAQTIHHDRTSRSYLILPMIPSN